MNRDDFKEVMSLIGSEERVAERLDIVQKSILSLMEKLSSIQDHNLASEIFEDAKKALGANAELTGQLSAYCPEVQKLVERHYDERQMERTA